jgi:hypothetical protein
VGLQNQLIATQVTPAARIPFTMFEEIDGPVELIVPAGVRNPPVRLIDDQE